MAKSRFGSEQYLSEDFVESAGAVLFRMSTQEICVLHYPMRNEYILAKGRRNCGESRQRAALREVTEETGFACQILPLTMSTRAPPAMELDPLAADEAHTYNDISEPFTLQIRRLGENNIKLIWWYVATVKEAECSSTPTQESEDYEVVFFNYKEVLQRLTFQTDRDMVQKAIDLVHDTYGGNKSAFHVDVESNTSDI